MATLDDERSQAYLRELHDGVQTFLPEESNRSHNPGSFVIGIALKAMSTLEGRQLLGDKLPVKKMWIQHCSQHFSALINLEVEPERQRDCNTALILEVLCSSLDLLESTSTESETPSTANQPSEGPLLIPWEYLEDLRAQLAQRAGLPGSDVEIDSNPYDTAYALVLCEKVLGCRPRPSSILDSAKPAPGIIDHGESHRYPLALEAHLMTLQRQALGS